MVRMDTVLAPNRIMQVVFVDGKVRKVQSRSAVVTQLELNMVHIKTAKGEMFLSLGPHVRWMAEEALHG